MGFVKGQPRPPGAGRKPGSKNKKKVAKVSEYLAEKDINPAQEILDLINDPNNGMFASDRMKGWFDLLSYCEAKPKAIEAVPDNADLDDEEFDDISNEDLLKLIKSPDGIA